MPTRTPSPQLCSPSQMWGVAAQRHAPHPATPPPPPPRPAAAAAAGLPGERACPVPLQPLLLMRLCPTCPFICPPAAGPFCPGDGLPV